MPRSWPLGHRITFMTYTMQRCTQEQSAGKCHLIRFVVSQHFSHFHSHSHQWLRCPRLDHCPSGRTKNPTCHPPFPPSSQLHSMKRVQERIVEDFQILKDFNLFQTSISCKIHKFSHPHTPKQPKQPLPLWRHQRM